MDRIKLNLVCFCLLTSLILSGLCKKCNDINNCLELESSGDKCKECQWLYAGDCCEKHCPEGWFGQDGCSGSCKCVGENFEKGCDITSGACRCKVGWSSTTCTRRDDTVLLNTTGDSTSTVLLSTEDTNDDSGTATSEERNVPLSVIVASVVGVAVIMATLSVCVVCAVRRAHGKRSLFGNGTESSQKDLISSTQTVNTSRSEYNYIDIPDPIITTAQAQNKTGLSDQQVTDETRPRRNRSVPGGTFVYDTVTDELILIDKLKKSQKRKRKRTLRLTEDQMSSSQNHNITDKNRKRKSSEDYNGRLGQRNGEYDSFNELAKRQKAGVSDDAEYSHLETARTGGDLYNTFEDLAEDRPNERVSPVFEYAHVSSVFAGKAGSYSYVDVKQKWSSDSGDFAGDYHHMKPNM